MTYISTSIDFALSLESYVMYEHERPQNKMLVTVTMFHGPLILPYILKTIWCINIILWDYESVWSDVWPQNKCRSLWPIFHCPVILPFILKTVWCINIIIRDYESVWPNIWPQNKCMSLWLILNDPVILPYILKTIWCINIILGDYLMDECHICRWDSMTQTLTSK